MSNLKSEIAIQIRTANPTDHAFIYNSWLKFFKNNSYFARRIKKDIYFAWHHQVIEKILAREGLIALIACDPESPETIWGYLIAEKSDRSVIHWVFVKEAFRRMGIGRALVEGSNLPFPNVYFTHWTSPPVGGSPNAEVFCVNQMIEKYPEMTYDPYRL